MGRDGARGRGGARWEGMRGEQEREERAEGKEEEREHNSVVEEGTERRAGLNGQALIICGPEGCWGRLPE